MATRKFLGLRIIFGLTSLAALVALLSVPLLTRADGNRVYYTPLESSFVPASAFGGMIAEGYGKGINKLTINAGPAAYTVNFTINNTNNGTKGTTYFETRKGPGNNDLSPNVKLSSTSDFTNATNTTFLDFTDTSTDANLYVQVDVPPCTSGTVGTFRIQAHPGGTGHQGNGPGVVVYVNCTGFIPPTQTPPPATCVDYWGYPIACLDPNQ
jgi:hypothetical protein